MQGRLRIRITLMRIRIPVFTLLRIRILLLIKVMRICDHWSTDPLRPRFDTLKYPASTVSVYGTPWLHIFEPLQVIDADPDLGPAFYSNADPAS